MRAIIKTHAHILSFTISFSPPPPFRRLRRYISHSVTYGSACVRKYLRISFTKSNETAQRIAKIGVTVENQGVAKACLGRRHGSRTPERERERERRGDVNDDGF